MKIQFFKPKSELLDKYVDGFYFIAESDTLASNQYWTFPTNFSLVTFCRNAALIPEEKKITVRRSIAEKTDSFLFYNISAPVQVTYENPISEVTIYFKPLAIFHFFPDVQLDPQRNHLENFEPYSDYAFSMKTILNLESKKQQAEALETYLLSKFQCAGQEMIEEILQKIEDDWKINDIAASLKVSRQYLNRFFFKHIGRSPAQYKKIQRFRQTIVSYHSDEKFISLSHKNMFFDQPHFNREFKAVTGVVPSLFFKNVDTCQNMLWLFA